MKAWAVVSVTCVCLLFAVFIPRFSSQRLPPSEIAFSANGENERDHKRSSEWPAVRAKHIKKHPACEACGGKKGLQVHHVIPYHLHPEFELDPENLITLCTDGPCHLNCHFVWGHLGNTKCNNPNVREDAEFFRQRLENRPCD